ncbi:MAG: extracellular solute-binding protein [Caldilineaceae bacterium]
MSQPQTHLTRRMFLKLVGTGIAGAALSACVAAQPAAESGASQGSSAPAGEAKSVTLMAFGESDKTAFAAAVEAFMKQKPEIKVETNFLPNDESYYATLQTQFAGGSNPDIASMQGWGYQLFADNKVIAGVNAMRERDNFNYAWADSEAVHQYTERNGDTFLIPTQMATMVMFYAKKPFDEAGIPYPTDDWTFDEFLDIAQKLTKTDGDKKQWGYQANGNWFRDIHWIRGTGAQEFDTLVDPKKSQFNQQEIIDIVQLIASDFYYKMGISPKPADLSTGSGGIEAGQSAMKYEGPWWFPTMVTQEKRDQGAAVEFDVVLMPKQADGNRPHRGWSEGVVIFSNKELDPAWEVAKFVCGEEGQKIFCEKSGRVPNNVSLIESFWAPLVTKNHGLTNTQAFITAFNKGEADIISGLPRSQYWNEVVKPVGWDPLLAGTASAAEVLPKVDEGVQKMLDDYWASK